MAVCVLHCTEISTESNMLLLLLFLTVHKTNFLTVLPIFIAIA